MDSVSEKCCTVYFGGRYYENWSEDYTLSIRYENRRQVLARFSGGRWVPVSGDLEICELLVSPLCPPLMQEYFQTAATVYTALHGCLGRGLPLGMLCECFRSEKEPLAAPELMRLLMDDCGLQLEEAYRITASCCDDLSCRGVQPQYIKAYQPRTAHVVSILRRTAERTPALVHDGRLPQYRSIPGAAAASAAPSSCSGATTSSTAGTWSPTGMNIM